MPVVTISRGSLSGGVRLAELVASALGYRALSREVLVEAARTYGVSEDRLAEGMEQPPGVWQRLVGQAESYVLAVQATLAEMLEEGEGVYHGLAGQFLLRGLPGVLKVRLIAPLDYRIRAAAAELGLTSEQAREHVQQVDRKRERWVRRLYGAEWADPSHYDLVLNLADIRIESAAEILVRMLKREEYQGTNEIRRAFKDFALATRVRANLRFRSPFVDHGIQVEVRDGVVRLSGGAGFERDKAAILGFVRNIRGVAELHGGLDLAAIPQQDGRETTARQLMVPLSGYPHIPETATLREALVAISGSSVRLEDGYLISPRYLLVLDAAGLLVGILSRRDLLRGLTPGIQRMQRAMESVHGVFRAPDYPLGTAIGWTSLLSPAAVECARRPVKTVMGPVTAVVSADDSLSTVVSSMLLHEKDLVPVIEGQRVVGVVLMTDIFDIVAQHVIEHGGGPPRPSSVGPVGRQLP